MKKDYRNLPILKHYKEGQLSTEVQSALKGEKSIFWFLKVGLGIATVYFSWIYVLPEVFKAIGQISATIVTIAVIGLTIFCLPGILRFMRGIARKVAEFAIKQYPFEELEKSLGKMRSNKENVAISKGKIMKLKTDSEIGAAEAEERAKSMKRKITSLSKEAKELKAEMDNMVKTMGEKNAKSDDKYIHLATKWRSTLSEAQRKSHKLEQDKDFVVKYGSRAAIMKGFVQKLTIVDNAMGIKILDFEASIEMLKKDYAFAKEAKIATSEAKSAMGSTEGWELDYALDVVTSTIAADVAQTANNLNDIDLLMTNYSTDSDELFEELNLLADKIDAGDFEIKSAKEYSGEGYVLTQEDRLKSGGFGDTNIF